MDVCQLFIYVCLKFSMTKGGGERWDQDDKCAFVWFLLSTSSSLLTDSSVSETCKKQNKGSDPI
jgi:hypothetical protein